MESNFNNRDFEQTVKRNADQYRMIPSEKVWKGINNTLHTRRRWYGIGLTSLLLLTAVSVTWVMVTDPVSKKQGSNSTQNIQPKASIPQVNSTETSPSNDIKGLLSLNKFNNKDKPAVSNQAIPEIVTTAPENITEPLITGNNPGNTELPLAAEKLSKNSKEKSEESRLYNNFSLGSIPGNVNGIATE